MTIDAQGFDRDFYLRENPDVAAAGIDPYSHYVQFGWREGRNPNAIFDVDYYLSTYADVKAAGIDPLSHYVRQGWREGRDPSIAFDTSDYRAANPDVAAAGINPLTHYLLFGQYEHRLLAADERSTLSEGFDRAYYLAANPDVAQARVDPYLHYQSYGNAEGRAPNAFFDKSYYLSHNPDVAAAGMDAFQHFLAFGWREGRDPGAAFSLAEYRTAIGGTTNENPLIQYLVTDRYRGLPSELVGPNPPQVIQARGNALNAVLAGQAVFTIDQALTHVSALSSPLDGHDLSGFTAYQLTQSTADITITGSGRLPLLINLGAGDDRIDGSFTLDGQILNLFAGAGTLSMDARIDNGSASINGGSGGSAIVLRGSADAFFNGGAGNDVVTLGSGSDSLTGGGGTNYLDGGAGIDTASWAGRVRADLLAGTAVSVGGGAGFTDTLVSIERLGGSAFDDVLLGDDRGNILYGVNFSPSPSGDDILAGRGGDDTLWGMDGADILLGGRGADTLIGGEGNDLLVDAADGWGSDSLYPKAYGNQGDDRLVYLLGAIGEDGRGNFMEGGVGADTYIIDPSMGRWGSLGIQFSQIDGDRMDLSMLRTAAGAALTLEDVRNAASTPFYGSTTISLSAFYDQDGDALAGRIVLNGVFAPSDLRTGDFLFVSAESWRTGIPADLLMLV